MDDSESVREDEAELSGEVFKPAVEAPYRWRDWAADPAGTTGDTLLRFVNQDEPDRPDGTRGMGLLAYLRGLQSRGDADRRDVIARVFESTTDRMESGYLLRDVINKVDEIRLRSASATQLSRGT